MLQGTVSREQDTCLLSSGGRTLESFKYRKVTLNLKFRNVILSTVKRKSSDLQNYENSA